MTKLGLTLRIEEKVIWIGSYYKDDEAKFRLHTGTDMSGYHWYAKLGDGTDLDGGGFVSYPDALRCRAVAVAKGWVQPRFRR